MTTITAGLAALTLAAMFAHLWHTQHRQNDNDRDNRAMGARLHARRAAEHEHRTNNTNNPKDTHR